MEHELLKRLEAEGFPQRAGIWVDGAGNRIRAYDEHLESLEGHDGWFYEPELEELIDACGKDFGELCQDPDGDWSACSRGDDGSCFIGGTKKEAVAELWLWIKNGKQDFTHEDDL